MQICNLSRRVDTPVGRAKIVAGFDLIVDEIRLNDLVLALGEDGSRLVWSPKARGRPAAHFGPGVRARIAALVERTLAEAA